MACANEKCWFHAFCEVKSKMEIDSRECNEFITIWNWWRDKIAGIRDPVPFADEEEFGEEDFDSDDL